MPQARHRTDLELSPTQQELVDWGKDRFRQAGLELPELEIRFHGDIMTCDGRVGLYDAGSGTVHICRSDKKTILHELAHPWTQHTLTDRDRSAFTELRGLNGWNDQSFDWAERGTEHAAEIIAWALMDRNILVPSIETTDTGIDQRTWRLVTIEDSHPDQLVDAYISLTGHLPILRIEDDPRLAPQSEVFSPEAQGLLSSTRSHASIPAGRPRIR